MSAPMQARHEFMHVRERKLGEDELVSMHVCTSMHACASCVRAYVV